MLWMDKTLNLVQPKVKLVAYTQNWVIFTGKTLKGQLRVKKGNGWLDLPKKVKVFVAPYSLIHWQFEPGVYQYQMQYFYRNFPEELPPFPIAKDMDSPGFELMDKPYWDLNLYAQESAYALVIKELIQDQFTASRSLETIFCQAKINPASAARAFKKTYHISPVQYRGLLRMMRAQELLLLEDSNVTDAAFNVGYTEMSQFYRQFKKYTHLNASQYL